MRVGAQLPVLAVGQVPEVDRGLGIEARRGDRVGMEVPVTEDAGAADAARLRAVDEHVVGMERKKSARKDRVVIDTRALLRREAGEGDGAAPAVARHAPFGVAHPHRPAQDRSFVEIVLGVAVGRQLVKVRMHLRAVITLAVIVEEKLPIGLDLVDALMDRPQLGEPPGFELAREARQGFLERDRIRGEIHEQQALPVGDGRRFEPVLLRIEAGDLGHVGRGAQAAVQPVGPGVVRTLKGMAELAVGGEAEAAAAVAAEVVEGADRSIVLIGAADDHDALPVQLEQEEAAGRGELRDVAGEEPGAVKDPLALGAEDLLGGEVLAGQGVLAEGGAGFHGG